MRAIVTGGAGFIGSHLIEALQRRGAQVVCVERPGASKIWLDGAPVDWRPVGLEDVDRLTALFTGADVVFHLAGLTQARTAAEYYDVNTEGTARVLEAAAAAPRPPRVLFLSSLAAIGPCRNGDLLSRHTVPCPLSHYGMSKLLAEAVLHSYADRVPVTVFRLSSVYGPRERGVLKMFQMVRRGIALTVGGWERQVSLIYVKDLVETLIAAAGSERTIGKTYCLAHPEPVRWSDFAREAGRALGRKPILLSLPLWVAKPVAVVVELIAKLRRAAAILNRERVLEISQERWVCDPTDAFADAGFRPRFDIGRGVSETVAWYQGMGWL